MPLRNKTNGPRTCTTERSEMEFVSFILTPLVAALLIVRDRDIPVADAHDVRDNSNSSGDLMQPKAGDEAGMLDDLHRENTSGRKNANAFFSQPPRFRKLAIARHETSPTPVNKKSTATVAKPMFKSAVLGLRALYLLFLNRPIPSQPEPKPKTRKNPAKKTRPNAEAKPPVLEPGSIDN
ncbi:hypothetical protein DFH06DRAFT_1300573 [Mycena polygramma]|nr:hypothetical protein DFH06DRAFT_1300573 [Mycena polygramma]